MKFCTNILFVEILLVSWVILFQPRNQSKANCYLSLQSPIIWNAFLIFTFYVYATLVQLFCRIFLHSDLSDVSRLCVLEECHSSNVLSHWEAHGVSSIGNASFDRFIEGVIAFFSIIWMFFLCYKYLVKRHVEHCLLIQLLIFSWVSFSIH